MTSCVRRLRLVAEKMAVSTGRFLAPVRRAVSAGCSGGRAGLRVRSAEGHAGRGEGGRVAGRSGRLSEPTGRANLRAHCPRRPAGAPTQQAASASAASAAPGVGCAGASRPGGCLCTSARHPGWRWGVSAGIPPDTCVRTGLTGRTAAVWNEGAMITLSRPNVCCFCFCFFLNLSEKLHYPAQDERQLQSSWCLAKGSIPVYNVRVPLAETCNLSADGA